MIDFVVDANVLMSILISGKSAYKSILSHFRFICPDFVLIEIEKYAPIIQQKSKLDSQELRQWTYAVCKEITILPRYIFDENILKKAHEAVKEIDSKDLSYVALAMQLNIVLITRDVPLYTHLRKNGFRKVLLFDEFLRKI